MRYVAVVAGTGAVMVAAATGLAAWLLHRLDVDLAGNRAFGDIPRTPL